MAQIPTSYYDTTTHNILLERLSQDDNIYINSNNINIDDLLKKRWGAIVSSFMPNYTNEYLSMNTQNDRNNWFMTYLNLPSHDLAKMPESLLS
jgi:hypothetical protein